VRVRAHACVHARVINPDGTARVTNFVFKSLRSVLAAIRLPIFCPM
jgi:hypothetical protein